MQTTHPSATSLFRRVPRRYGGISTSQTDRICTGLSSTMHHIDPSHAACRMLLLHCMKGKKHTLITGLSVPYHFPPFSRTSCVGVSVYRNRHYRSFIHFILFTLYWDTVTLYYSNGYITGYFIIRDIYNVSKFTIRTDKGKELAPRRLGAWKWDRPLFSHMFKCHSADFISCWFNHSTIPLYRPLIARQHPIAITPRRLVITPIVSINRPSNINL
jgi:hypothetical protein